MVLAGKSIEEWLKIKGFLGLVGFITVGGGPLFLCFLMPLIGWRLGEKSYYQAKVYFHAKVRGFRDSIKWKGKKE